MSKAILEDKIGPHLGHAAGDTDAEKKASQLASDVKYKVRQELGKDTSLNPAEIAKKYLQQLAKSPAPAAVKLIAKKKLEGSSTPSSSSTPVSEEAGGDDRVWIVVTDKKTGNTYRRSLRKSTAEKKIADLRSNPNISRVERTSYHPDDKDDVQGKKTARVKAGKGLDQDGDGDKDFADVMSARMQASGMSKSAANKKVSDKPYNKKSGVSEGFSNWRSDLIEVVDDEISNQKKGEIKEKKVENKITINPNLDLGEKINQMGGELIEMVEIDEELSFEGVLDEICDAELVFLSNDIIEQAVEEFFLECIEEGYEVKDVEEMLIESLDTSLEMICEVSDSYYDSAVETSKKNASKLGRRESKINKIKDTVKKVGKSLAHGVGYAARKVVSTAKKVGSEVKKGYEAAKETEKTSDSTSSGTRKPQPYRYAKKAEKKPGIASRLGSALKSGLKKAVASGARAVSRGARNVARSMSEENIQEVSPPGFEGTVKAMKKHGEIDNPYALAWYMKNKGYKSHRKKTGGVEEAVASPIAQKQDQTQDMQQKQQQQKLQKQKPDPADRKLASIQKMQLSAKLKQVQQGIPLKDSYEIEEGRAIGSASSSDTNPRGAAVRASSGSGMTMTKAGGLGKSKSTANNPAADDLRKKYFDNQAKADRRAAAKERAASGEDRVGKLIRSVQNSHYSPEGEMVDEATAAAKRGVAEPHRGDVEGRREKAAASVAAVKKRQSVLDKHEKKTGVKLDVSRSKEGKEHARNFPASRQAPKQKGEKETPSETHNRRVGRHNQRVMKHGFTSKEKKDAAGYSKYEADYKKSYGQNKSAWD